MRHLAGIGERHARHARLAQCPKQSPLLSRIQLGQRQYQRHVDIRQRGDLTEALAGAAPREIAPARAQGMPENSRIVTAANAQIGLGLIGAVGSVGAQIAPAVAQAEGAQTLAVRVLALLGLDGAVSAALPWIGAAVFIGVILYAVKARTARIEDHRTGRTP